MLDICILMKYSKSGTIAPVIKPVKENHLVLRLSSGKTIAGCANVKGIGF
jgi:hypothetical protein